MRSCLGAFLVIACKRKPRSEQLDRLVEVASVRLRSIAASDVFVRPGRDFAVIQQVEDGPAEAASSERACGLANVVVFDGWVKAGERTGAVSSLLSPTSFGNRRVAAPDGAYASVGLQLDSFGQWTRAVAIRDHVGLRPLFEAECAEFFAFSNFPGVLAALPGIGCALNAGYAAEYLSGEINSIGETHFVNVRRIPSGSIVRLDRSNGLRRVNRYWQPASSISRGSSAELTEEFRRLLVDAVRASTQGSSGMALALSGGIDSSCLAVVLADLVDGGCVGGGRARAASLVFPDAAVDESAFVDDVAAVVPFRIDRHPVRYATAEQLQALTDRFHYPFGPFTSTGFSVIAESMRARGERILLNGEGGDELLVPYAGALWGALSSTDEWPALATFCALHYERNVRRLRLRGQPRTMFAPWLGWSGQNLFNRYRDRPRQHQFWSVDQLWASRVSLRDRLDRLVPPPGCRTLAMALATSGYWSEVNEGPSWFGYSAGIELRSPLMDRALLEFCNSLPLAMLDGQGGLSRQLLRNACSPRLPASIALRRSKPEFSAVVRRSLNAVARARFGVCWSRPKFGVLGHSQLSESQPGSVWQLDAAQAYAAFIGAAERHGAQGK